MIDPTTGRRMSADPLFPASGLNPNVFVRNNPTNLRDPSGLKVEYEKDGKVIPVTQKETTDLNLKNANLPTNDYLKKLGIPVTIVTADKFTDLVRETMSLLARPTTETRTYKSLDQFINDAMYRAWVVVFAKQLMAIEPKMPPKDGVSVATFPGSTNWDPDPKVKVNRAGQESTVTGLQLKEGVSPADGIKEFFGANGKKATLDCQTFFSVVNRRALLEVFKGQQYDKLYKNVSVGTANVHNDPFVYEAGITSTPPGSLVKFTFPKEYEKETGNYYHEITIYIGGGLLIGQPYRTAMKASEMQSALRRSVEFEDKMGKIKQGLEMEPRMQGGFDLPFQKLPK